MRIGCYQTHPACDLFPLMSEAELDELAEDIRRHGLRSPIILHEGCILDGRNRLLACIRVGAEPRFDHWRGPGSPIAWLLSVNLHRRHLDTSQRAMIAARALSVFEAEARARQGARTDLRATLRGRDWGKASEHAAALVNVAPRTVEHAKVVVREGGRALVEAVERGRVSVSAAAAAARRAALRGAPNSRGAAEPDVCAAAEREPLPRCLGASDAEARCAFDVLAAFPDWSRPAEVQRYGRVRLDAVAAPDAVLFLTAPDPALPTALRLIAHWRFEFRSSIVARRATPGDGPIVRECHEFILIGTRGAHPPVPPRERRPESVLELRGGDDAVLAQIEQMFPQARRVQLFARSPRAEWSDRP